MNKESEKSGTSYELILVLAGSLNDAETKKQVEKWEEELGKIGKVLNKAIWEKRALAYKIKQESTGTYLVAHFEAAGKKIAELENALRLSPKVIRHLIYKTPHSYEWKEYSEEDLEYDFTKLEKDEDADKPAKRSYAKKKEAPKRTVAKKTEGKEETPKAEKKEVKADVGEIDKKLDDILADL